MGVRTMKNSISVLSLSIFSGCVMGSENKECVSLSFTDFDGPGHYQYTIPYSTFLHLSESWNVENGDPPVSRSLAIALAEEASNHTSAGVSRLRFIRSWKRGNEVWFWRVDFEGKSAENDVLVLLDRTVISPMKSDQDPSSRADRSNMSLQWIGLKAGR